MVPTAYKFDTWLQKIVYSEFKSGISIKNIFLSTTDPYSGGWGTLPFLRWVSLVSDGRSALTHKLYLQCVLDHIGSKWDGASLCVYQGLGVQGISE